jgi:glycosyltransferase involved in cell wall biosynthesis
MSVPKISVLMSVYNGEQFLEDSINSILAQDFGDFEFLIINDGSTDYSSEIINNFSKLDKRIKLFNQENKGLAFSLNRGLLLANAALIARIDADDISYPKRLKSQYDHIKKNKLVLLGSACDLIDHNGCLLTKKKYPQKHDRIIRHLLNLGSPFPHSSAMFSTSLALAIGGYSSRFPRAEDRKLWLDLSRAGHIGCLQNSLVAIRQHTNQISHEDGGIQQFYDALSANVNYLYRINSKQDLSATLSDEDWKIFTCEIRTSKYDSYLRDINQFKIDYYKKYNSTNPIHKIFSLIFNKHIYKLIYFRIIMRRISKSTFTRLKKFYLHF